MKTIGYAAFDKEANFKPWEIERREVGENDVLIEILYCGICHSDIHCVKNEWGGTVYPIVPGHEIIGKVEKVGGKVNKFKPGDFAGVGCMVNSCKQCSSCKNHEEYLCEKGVSLTYNSTERDKKTPTYGGYSRQIVVDSDFVLQVSNKFANNLQGVAPTLCAGITTYYPLTYHKDKVGPGKKVAINGLGGLGHMGVKLAASLGAEVTVISTSPSKEKDAKRLGATHFLISKDEEAMKNSAGTFDLILDTVAAQHPIDPLIKCLKNHGVLAIVGAPPKPQEFNAFGLLDGNKTISGSMIGGIEKTQEMLDYCAEKGIVSDVEMITIDRLNEAYDRTIKGDVKYRFVIDVSSIQDPSQRSTK